MFLHFFFILVYFVISLFSSNVALSLAVSLHATSMLVERHLVRKVSIDPLTCYGVYSFCVGIANLVIMADLETDNLPLGYSYIIPANIQESIGIFFLGNAFIFIGYELFSRKSLPKISILIESGKNHQLLFFVMLALSARNFFFQQTVLGSLTTILTVFSSISIMFFSRLWARFDDKTYRTYALTLFVLQTVYAVMYSYLRLEIIAPIVCMSLGYFLGKKSLKEVFSYKVIPVIVALYTFNAFFSFLGENRTKYGEARGFDRIEQMIVLANVEEIYVENENKENIVYRASVLPQITNVVELVKNKGHFNGDVSAPLLIALVPRFLWPEKPLIGLGAWFATEIGQGMQTESWYTNSINMTIQGHLFLDFAWIGIVIGCLLVGGILALLWNATGFYSSPYNITGITLGGYLLMTSIQGIGADLQIMVTFTSYYLIFFALRKIV